MTHDCVRYRWCVHVSSNIYIYVRCNIVCINLLSSHVARSGFIHGICAGNFIKSETKSKWETDTVTANDHKPQRRLLTKKCLWDSWNFRISPVVRLLEVEANSWARNSSKQPLVFYVQMPWLSSPWHETSLTCRTKTCWGAQNLNTQMSWKNHTWNNIRKQVMWQKKSIFKDMWCDK